MGKWGTAPIAALAGAKGLAGGPFGSTLGSKDYTQSGVPVIRGTNLDKGRFVGGDFVYVSETKVRDELARNVAVPGDLVFTQRGTLGQIAVVGSGGPNRFVVSQSQMRLRVDPGRADAMFVYYACSTEGFHKQVADHAIATGVPHINLGILSRLTIPLPPLEEQRAIADVLTALDDKIAADTRLLNAIREHLGLEFSAALSRGSAALPLGAVAAFQNRKRVPLSAREREDRPGPVPYYGATGVFGHVDESIFDEPLVLVGEDGSVVTDEGNPVVQYIWGPSWVNNHAHVLTGLRLSTELLYFAIARQDVRSLVTGAVQPKISMGNLGSLQLDIPSVPSELRRLEGLIAAEMAVHRSVAEQSATLVLVRDALLPALMSGRLRVRDAASGIPQSPR